MPTGKRGVAYLRVSRDQQETARQRSAIRRWESQQGVEIQSWFEDTGSRDLAAKRPDFQRLLRAIEAGLIDWVVVDSQDRFGTKDAHEWGKFNSLLNDHGCELWSVAQGLLSATDDATILTGTIGALTSTREQKERAGRNIKGKVAKAKAGLYQGGYSPYGCDVACYDKSGKEKWRVLYTGHFRRLKIQPDGTRQEFNGRGNFPAKDPTDELRLAPSVEARRVEVVRLIFETYAEEAIPLNALARKLNDLEVDPVFGDRWNQPKIKHVLTNPAYIGFPAWNKKGGSRFMEFVDGQFREVPREKGKVTASRHRRPEDYVQTEHATFEPMIDRELWDRVQRKLEAAKATNQGRGAKKGPRSAELWLRGFLVCGRCGKPMRGWHPRGDKYLFKSYFCGTYGNYGPKNPSGCKLHRVRAELLESVVEEYLTAKHGQLKAMVEAQEKSDYELLRPMEEDLARKWAELAAIERRMAGELGAKFRFEPSRAGTLFFEEDPEKLRDMTSYMTLAGAFRDIWGIYHGLPSPEVEGKIVAAESELARLVDSYGDLPKGAKRARELANARVEDLEARINALRAEQEDLGQRWDDLQADFLRTWEATGAALEALKTEGAHRRKAEAFGKVVDKIICHFKHDDSKGRSAKSFLEIVEVLPAEGLSVKYYPNAASPERG